jgi:hypothetical protein
VDGLRGRVFFGNGVLGLRVLCDHRHYDTNSEAHLALEVAIITGLSPRSHLLFRNASEASHALAKPGVASVLHGRLHLLRPVFCVLSVAAGCLPTSSLCSSCRPPLTPCSLPLLAPVSEAPFTQGLLLVGILIALVALALFALVFSPVLFVRSSLRGSHLTCT